MPDLILQDQSLRLDRYPLRRDDRLQPWDSADEFLLNRIREICPDPEASVLVINDSYGALTIALGGRAPTTWNDSFMFRMALEHNLEQNQIDAQGITFVPSDKIPSGTFDLVVLKFPKSLAFLEDQLLRLRPILHPGSRVLAGGMIKHTPKRAYELLEKIIGPVGTSLGWKKSRLAETSFDPGRDLPPHLPDTSFDVKNFDWTLMGGPNVFSRDHLDMGTRVLLNHLPETGEALRVADLGCGNGILALAVATRCPEASVLGVDESYQAIACAQKNLQQTGLTERGIRFKVGDGLTDVEPGSLDLVVCNPPFHQARTVGDQLAWTMFSQAKRALKEGGELRIVGNRHLGYHLKLNRLFGNATVLGSDRKFVVLRSVRGKSLSVE